MAYSKDFKQQALKQLKAGKTYRQLSEKYNISTGTIKISNITALLLRIGKLVDEVNQDWIQT